MGDTHKTLWTDSMLLPVCQVSTTDDCQSKVQALRCSWWISLESSFTIFIYLLHVVYPLLLYIVRGSNSGGGEILRTRPDRPWGPPSLLYNSYGVSIPGVKMPGRGLNDLPSSSAEVKERVELYLYSLSGISWQVMWWTSAFTLDSNQISKSTPPSTYFQVIIHQLPIQFIDSLSEQ